MIKENIYFLRNYILAQHIPNLCLYFIPNNKNYEKYIYMNQFINLNRVSIKSDKFCLSEKEIYILNSVDNSQ